jgi:predicted nucleic acid-binding protein
MAMTMVQVRNVPVELHRRLKARAAIEGMTMSDLTRHAHEPLLGRVWALRQNFSACDAVYVALAEMLDASLVTCDRRLAHAPGMKNRAILI